MQLLSRLGAIVSLAGMLASATLASAMLGACAQSEGAPAVSESSTIPEPPDGRAILTVKANDAGSPLDARLFGTSVPAWVNPTGLANEAFRATTKSLGASVLRMPGGSWSSGYNWLACENGSADEGCSATWAARPTDFLQFVRAVGAQGMWTVNFNGTSKEAAALVAFFNGQVDDTTRIGTDVRGKDWKRVGDWANLRAAHGNAEPLAIRLWEVGNEVYGAKPSSAGGNCPSWGWEDVWTCDANEYMLGRGTGTARREGYLEFRKAMRAVDPNIQVGAVGVPHPGDWSDWGTKVIERGGADLDFYIIHTYAFDAPPATPSAVLSRPQALWSDILRSTNDAFDKLATRKRVPIAVTEYNLTSFLDNDNAQLMTRAVNALFIADMVGQLATHGATMANQWNLANGRGNMGSDYGLVDAPTATRAPQYYALRLWTTMGNTLLPIDSPLPTSNILSSYATRSADGTISVLAINKTSRPVNVRVGLAGVTRTMRVSLDVVSADDLTATTMRVNGVLNPAVDFSNAPAQSLGTATGFLDHSVAPFSISVLRFSP